MIQLFALEPAHIASDGCHVFGDRCENRHDNRHTIVKVHHGYDLCRSRRTFTLMTETAIIQVHTFGMYIYNAHHT